MNTIKSWAEARVTIQRKSSLWGCYKPRHVTIWDVFLFINSKPYRTALLYSLIVQPYHTALLYSLIEQSYCTAWLDSLIVQPYCTILLNNLIGHPMLLTETCCYSENQIFEGVNNLVMSLIKTRFCSWLYGNWHMAIEKIKILGAVLEPPAKQHCQFSPFGPFSKWICWIGSACLLVAPKRPPRFWFFQWPWMLIIHLSLFPLRPVRPNLLDIINHSLAVCLSYACSFYP